MSKISSKSSLSPKQKKCSCGTLSKLWPDLGKIVSIHLICYRYKLLPFLRIMILLSTVVVGWGRGATLGRLTSVYALLASLILAVTHTGWKPAPPTFQGHSPKQKSWKTYCPSHAGIVSTLPNIPFGSPAILVFPYQTVWQYSDWDLHNGASNARGVWKKSRFSTNISLCLRNDARAIVTMEGE